MSYKKKKKKEKQNPKTVPLDHKSRNVRRSKFNISSYNCMISLVFVNCFSELIGKTTLMMFSLVESPEIL